MNKYFEHHIALKEHKIERANKRRAKRFKAYDERCHSNSRCPYCGRTMSWCDICRRYTSTCCIEYGTCMCS